MSDEFTREKELAMIMNHEKWPGDTLCLKRRPGPGEKSGVMGYTAFGVIASSRAPLTVYLRGARDFEKTMRYDTAEAMMAEAMMADGWEVD